MSERKANCKRDAEDAEFEASSTSFTSLKRMRLGDSVDFGVETNRSFGSSSLARAASSASASGGCSASSTGENDDQSSSVCSGCSSSEMNGISKNELKFVDLEAPQISETDISTCITNNFREDRNPASEVLGETAEMDSKSAAATARRDRRKPPEASNSPTEAELEEFFSAAEKYEQKRFAEKYNYDVVKDAPLEGRYQWVRLSP